VTVLATALTKGSKEARHYSSICFGFLQAAAFFFKRLTLQIWTGLPSQKTAATKPMLGN